MDPDCNTQQEERPALVTYADVAGRLELSLTHPALNEEQVDAACRKAIAYRFAAVVVRPSDVDMAVRIFSDSPVALASVTGFPHGSSNTATKLYEGRDLLRRGAREINFVVNYGKLLSRHFQHVETEIQQMSESCQQAGAYPTIFFHSAYLAEDLKIILCKIGKRTGCSCIETDAVADLPLLKKIARDAISVKVAASPGTLNDFNRAYAGGSERFSSTNAFAIADAWKVVLAAREAEAKHAVPAASD